MLRIVAQLKPLIWTGPGLSLRSSALLCVWRNRGCGTVGREAAMKKKGKVTESSGNVFEDIGLEDAAELAIKSDLVAAIYRTITAHGFKNQTEAAVRMGMANREVPNCPEGIFEDNWVKN